MVSVALLSPASSVRVVVKFWFIWFVSVSFVGVLSVAFGASTSSVMVLVSVLLVFPGMSVAVTL
jgi:hypothetical protein